MRRAHGAKLATPVRADVDGLLLAAGLLTRPVAGFIAVNRLVALIFAHAGDPFGGRELPMLFGFVALLFALTGGGRYAVDALIRRT